MPLPRWKPREKPAYRRPPRAQPVEPPAIYPEDTLTYLANVYNHKARDFYAQARRAGHRRRPTRATRKPAKSR